MYSKRHRIRKNSYSSCGGFERGMSLFFWNIWLPCPAVVSCFLQPCEGNYAIGHFFESLQHLLISYWFYLPLMWRRRHWMGCYVSSDIMDSPWKPLRCLCHGIFFTPTDNHLWTSHPIFSAIIWQKPLLCFSFYKKKTQKNQASCHIQMYQNDREKSCLR